MENITTGMINADFVAQFQKCLHARNGHMNNALRLAYKDFNLNAANSTEENDSWHEAYARFKAE